MKIIRPLAITDSILLSSNVPETDYAAWNSGTTYAIGNRVIVVATHQVYESVINGNLNQPVTDTTKWLNIGYTNRWKMFDKKVGTLTENTNTIVTSTKANSVVDSLAFFRVSAQSIRILVTDDIEGVVYDTTKSLISDSGVNDWYPFFFEPIVRMEDVSFFDLPPYSNSTIQITSDDTGATASCGACVMGQQRYVGQTEMGSSIGLIDYSRKDVDQFGNIIIVERPFSKRGNFQLYMDRSTVSEIQKLFALYRATPVVWWGDDESGDSSIEAMLMYGYYKDFEITVAYPTMATCSLTIEGLT